jgi:hypothetical protein
LGDKANDGCFPVDEDLASMYEELPEMASVQDFENQGFQQVQYGGLQSEDGDFVVVLHRGCKWVGVGFR